jgi:hypothetical protein
VIINDGIGDSGDFVRAARAGVVLPESDRAAFDASAAEVDALFADAGIAARCRDLAAREFSLAAGVAAYGKLYEQLA